MNGQNPWVTPGSPMRGGPGTPSEDLRQASGELERGLEESGIDQNRGASWVSAVAAPLRGIQQAIARLLAGRS